MSLRGRRVRLKPEAVEWIGTRAQVARGDVLFGTVLGFGRDVPGVRVRLDGKRRGVLLPLDFVVPVEEPVAVDAVDPVAAK